MQNLTWYVPSFFGDIRLERTETGTLLVLEALTPAELSAVGVLRTWALAKGVKNLGRTRICTPDAFPDMTGPSGSVYRDPAGYKIKLSAPIEDVQSVLSKAMKPGRSLVSAVRFAGGKIEETVATDESALPPSAPDPEPEKKKGALAKAAKAVATTVAAPLRGCPQPEFETVTVKATRVLSAFLTADQLADFEERQAFVATGADTGHRYLVTSRHAVRWSVKHGDTFKGQLHDLDERRTFCVHDWDVPAPEEMLGLLIHLALPGRELYLRDLPPAHGAVMAIPPG